MNNELEYNDPDAAQEGGQVQGNQSKISDDDLDSAGREAKSFQVPYGTFAAVLDQIVRWDNPTSGTACFRADYYLFVDEEDPCHKDALFFQMKKADGSIHDGAGFYVQFMAALGYDQSQIGKEARETIKREKPGFAIAISPQKKNPQYPKRVVKGLLKDDNQEIVAIREAMANLPQVDEESEA